MNSTVRNNVMSFVAYETDNCTQRYTFVEFHMNVNNAVLLIQHEVYSF